ncbi:MAG: tyrosine-type recombinase/integrase [Betaproteobacteria bacterium]|jgi:site-specific recombinase XerD|nr:tyrosine-type recombinase/integrase [Betaproteobacteria bacterium]
MAASEHLRLPVSAGASKAIKVSIPMHQDEVARIFEGVMGMRASRLSLKLAMKRDDLSDQSRKTFKTMLEKVVSNLFKAFGSTLLDCTTEQVQSAVATNGRRGTKNAAKAASAETVRRYYTLMTDVFEYMIQDGKRTTNPARPLLQVSRAGITYDADHVSSSFTEADEKKFIESLNVYVFEKSNEWTRRRDRAMLMLMLAAGLKPSEAVSLTLGQIERHNRTDDDVPALTVHVRTTGIQHSRIVPVDDFAAAILNEWLHLRATIRTDCLSPESLLFPPLTGFDQISTNTVYGVMVAVLNVEKEQAKVLPWEKSKGTNTLRNTYCIRHLANGTPAEVLAERMGFRMVESIDRYAKVPYRPGSVKVVPVAPRPTLAATLFD